MWQQASVSEASVTVTESTDSKLHPASQGLVLLEASAQSTLCCVGGQWEAMRPGRHLCLLSTRCLMAGLLGFLSF